MTRTTFQSNLVILALAGLLGACPAAKSKSGIQPLVNPAPQGAAEAPATNKPIPPVAAVFPNEAFRDQQPTAGAPREFNLPGITQFQLGKEISVYLVERHQLPTISMELNFDGGTVTDRPGHEGTAALCMSMMSEGTKKLDKLAFEAAKADLASSVYSYANSESQGVALRSLTKNFDATFALFRDTLVDSGMRNDELGRMTKSWLESLAQSRGTPASIMRRVASSVLLGKKHPLAHIVTEKSLGSIKIADCKRYVKAYIRPKGARLFVVGDMSEAQIRAKFAPLLATWKGSPKKIAKISKPSMRKGRVFFVDVPGAAQSSIAIGTMGPSRTAPGFFTNQMLAGVLGSGFSGRINMNLREDKGYTYGAGGGFSYNRHFGLFRAGASVRSDATRQSLQELFKEMQALKSGTVPATAEELLREKSGAIKGLPAQFATAKQVLSAYQTLVYYGLPMNYYNQYVGHVSTVTLGQVNSAAATLLRPQDAIILVVGDGSAKQIVRDAKGKDVPRISADGKVQLTLKDTLVQLAASAQGGKGKLVILDADGNVAKKK